MALVFKDRVKVTSTTTGTGTLTLGSAVSGFQNFSVIGDGNTTYYTITDQSGNWEVGLGTYASSGTTLSRDTILESSNSGSAVDFPAGTKTVFVTYPAEKSVIQDASGNVTLQGVLTPSGGISNGATFNKTGSGGEGGELHLEKGATSTLSGDVVIDAYNQSIRIFENGGTNRGAQLDVSSQSAGVGSTLLTSSTSAASFPTLNQNTTGTAAGLSATLAIASGGTGQTTKAAAFNALSPITSTGDLILGNGSNSATRLAIGANNTVLTSNGTTASWAAAGASLSGQTDSASPYETSLGYEAGKVNTGANNTFVGYQSGTANTNGASNVSAGYQALLNNTTGSENVAIGYLALKVNTTATGNTAIGNQTLDANTTGYANTAVGTYALSGNTIGTNNVAVGDNAMYVCTTGSNNSAFGSNALSSSTTSDNNSAFGAYSAYSNTTGTGNTAIGKESLFSNTTGNGNTAVGINALYSTTGNYNTALGNACLYNTTTGGYNIGIGYNAAYATTTGMNNVAIGTEALRYNTDGEENIAIGNGALRTQSSGVNYNVGIGKDALRAGTTGYNNVAIGCFSSDNSTTAYQNTSVGYNSSDGLTTGYRNTCIGNNAGNNLDTGTGNVMIGHGTWPSASNGTNQIAIGYAVQGQGNSYATLGSSSGKVYCAYTSSATWTQTSDGTMKNVIGKDTLGLSFINKLKPVIYKWKPQNELPKNHPYYSEKNGRDTNTIIHGFVAQDVKAAMESEGCTTFNGWDEGPDGIQAISREMFVSPLVKAVQELSEQIDALKLEIVKLKGA